MNGRLRVVIATTEGPSTVRRITPEDPELRSVVCLAGTATALPISGDYDAFVRRPTGVVERDTGHRVFRTDVDRPIDEGRSWQLGLYIAHRLKAADRLAEDDTPAAGIVWATGTLDSDLTVGAVERVADKVRRSAPLFDGDLPVLAVVAAEHAVTLPDRAECLAVHSAGEALLHLGLTSTARTSAPGRSGRKVLTAVALALAVAGAVWAVREEAWRVSGPERPGDTPVAVSRMSSAITATAEAAPGSVPVPVSFEVLEARLLGDTCGPDHAVTSDTRASPGVCAVAFRATNDGGRPLHFWLYGAVQGAVLEYASRRRQTELAVGILAPGEAAFVRVQPPDWMRRSVVMRGLLITARGARPQVDQALISIDLMTAQEIDTLVAGLRTLDLDLREISHEVTPAR